MIPQIARLIGSVGQYAYAVGTDDTIYVHLYISSTATITLSNGSGVKLTQEASAPWRGGSTLTLESISGTPVQHSICLRKPPGIDKFIVSHRFAYASL